MKKNIRLFQITDTLVLNDIFIICITKECGTKLLSFLSVLFSLFYTFARKLFCNNSKQKKILAFRHFHELLQRFFFDKSVIICFICNNIELLE